jgi:PAS domain S-box-containing protein
MPARADKRFDALLLASASIVWWTNAAGEFVEEQPSWREYTGQTWEEYRGSAWVSCLHPDDRASIIADWTSAVASGSPYFTQGRIWSAKHNAYRAFQTRGIPIKNESGQIEEWLGALTDIQDSIDIKALLDRTQTDLADSLKALRLSEARLRDSQTRLSADAAAMKRLNDASSRLWQIDDLHTGLDEILRASIELLGADKGNVQLFDARRGILTIEAHRGFEQPFLDFFQEVSTEDDSACGRALRSGRRIVIEDVEADEDYAPYRAMAAAAGYRAVQSTPLLGRNGSPVGMMSTHFARVHRPTAHELQLLDLYARQAIDFLERYRNEDALRRSELRWRTMTEALPNLVWTDLPDGQCDWLGRQWGKYTGIAEQELLGLNWLERVIHPGDRERTLACWQAACRDEADYDLEYRIRRHDGEYRWFKTRGVPVRDDDGKIVYWFGTCTDIEDVKRAEERERALREQTHILMREVNHRAKNLLAVVQAVARYSAAGRPADFLSRFEQRLSSLAAGQDLLIKSQWKGIAIEELVQAQLLHCQDLLGTRIALRGPSLTIAASACQTLGMALNELCTNATKYGALSNDTGHVEIVWDTQRIDGGDQFTIEWREHGGPSPSAPSRHGFGFTVIHDIIRQTFDAEILLDYAPAGLIWRVRCPAAKILEGSSLPREKERS